MSVVGLIGGGNTLARCELAGDPQRFEVGEGSSAAQVAQMMRPVKHLRQRGDGFNLHGGAGTASVKRVIIGVDRHGERIGSAGDGMWRLQHLPCVERVGVGVVIVETGRGFLEDGSSLLIQRRRRGGRKIGKTFVEAVLSGVQESEEFVIGHGSGMCAANYFAKNNFLQKMKSQNDGKNLFMRQL